MFCVLSFTRMQLVVPQWYRIVRKSVTMTGFDHETHDTTQQLWPWGLTFLLTAHSCTETFS